MGDFEVAHRDCGTVDGGVPWRGTFRHKLRRSHNPRRAPGPVGRRIVLAWSYSNRKPFDWEYGPREELQPEYSSPWPRGTKAAVSPFPNRCGLRSFTAR